MKNKMKNMSKKTKAILSVALAVIVVFSIFAIPYINFNNADDIEIINVNKDEFSTNKAAYNRGEWLTILSEKFKIDLKNVENANDFYFNDTENTKYCAVAETFAMYGFIPVTEKFEAEKPVTRAYTAYTIAKIMGYENTQVVDLLDIENSFEKEISIVVCQGYMSTSNGYFYPDEYLSEKEKNQIFKCIDEVNASAIVKKSDIHNNSKFADGVISTRLKFVKEYSVEIYENEVLVVMPKNIITTSLKNADVIVLPQTEEYPNGYVLKITSIETVDDKLVVSSIKPEIYEVFETIDVASVVSPNMSDIEVANGVTLNNSLNANLVNTLSQNIVVDDNVDDLPGTTFEFDEEFENLGLSGKVTLKIPLIEYRMKGSVSFKEGLDCTDFLFKLQNDIETEATISFEDINIGDLQSQKHEFATIPIPLAYGFAAELTFYINVSADGSVTVTNNCSLIAGYQYKNGASRSIFNFEKQKNPPVEICVSGKIGLGCVLNLSFAEFINLAGYEYEVGLKIDGKVYPNVINKKLVYCSDISVYFYARSGIDSESALGLFLDLYNIKVEFEHLKPDDSNPCYLNFHFEDSKLVTKCSYYDGISTTVRKYSEEEVKTFFNSLLEDYCTMELFEILYSDEDDFSNIKFDYLLGDKKYTKYYLSNSSEVLKTVNYENTSLTMTDIMNEEEKTKFFKDSAQHSYRTYKVYNITDVDEVISKIWRPGRFKIGDLHAGDFNVNFVTSKGYLVSPVTDAWDYYGYFFGEYISCKENNNEYKVKAYLIETPEFSPVVSNKAEFFDAATGKKLGVLNIGLDTNTDAYSFDDIIRVANIKKSNLIPVDFVFEATVDGLRFKSFKDSIVSPDKEIAFATMTVIADGGLNLRTAPSSNDSTVITLIPEGDFVWVEGASSTTDEWVYVSYIGENDSMSCSGWVNRKFLK